MTLSSVSGPDQHEYATAMPGRLGAAHIERMKLGTSRLRNRQMQSVGKIHAVQKISQRLGNLFRFFDMHTRQSTYGLEAAMNHFTSYPIRSPQHPFGFEQDGTAYERSTRMVEQLHG